MSDKKFNDVKKSLEKTSEWKNLDEETATRVLNETYGKYKDRYGVPTIVSFIRGKLRNEKKSIDAESVTGFTLGGCDREGKKLPVSHVLVKSDKKMEKIVAWKPGIIPSGAHIVTIKGTFNDSFMNYQIEELVEAKPVDDLSKISSAALTINDESQFENYLGAGSPCMVKGRIAYVNPVFNKDDEGNRADANPILFNGNLTCEIVLEYDGLVSLNLRLNPQNKGKPYVGISDIDNLVEDAMTDFETAEDQANFLQMALQGRMVLATGDIMNISERFTKEGERKLPVYISVGGIIEIPEEAQTVDKPKEEEIEKEFEQDAVPVNSKTINALAEQIVEFCKTVNKTPTMVSPTSLKKAGIGEGYTNAGIELGIHKAKSLYDNGAKQA